MLAIAKLAVVLSLCISAVSMLALFGLANRRVISRVVFDIRTCPREVRDPVA